MHLLPATNSGEPRLQAARKTDRGTIFILRPHATACNLTLEGGTNIGVIIPLCDDSDPCAENEIYDSKLEKLTRRGAMTPACAVTPACAINRTITVHPPRAKAGEGKIGFPENETSMVRRWLHDLEPVNYLENLGHIDHCACFPRTQSQSTYVEGEILRIRGNCRPRRPRRLCRWD